MKNKDVLFLAVQVMHVHNSTCGYETFSEINLHNDDEVIEFNIQTSMLNAAFMICELFNLDLHIEPNTDPSTDKKLNFYIN